MNNFTKQFRIATIALAIALSALSVTGCKDSADGGGGDKSTVINIAAIEGVIAPVDGETPVTSITENEQYSGTVTWSPSHATFAVSTEYTATITLTPQDGYTLRGVAANFFYVEGATMAINDTNSGVITALFPAARPAPRVITIDAISGITPAVGETPVTVITENEQYSGTVTWSPDHSTFAANTQYTATITLTPKTGYTLQGVTRNFFTVSVATATNAANSGVVTAVFAQVSEVLTVTNTAEWTDACNYIALSGNGAYNAPKAYIIRVNGDISVPIVIQTFGTVSDVIVTLQGNGRLFPDGKGKMIQTTSGQTLIIDSPGLTLQGPEDNNTPLMYCTGKLEMRNGTITGGINTGITDSWTSYGGVVLVGDFTMSGGTISGSSNVQAGIGTGHSYGGGVYVARNFTMSGGTISGSSNVHSQWSSYSYGGGVYVAGIFTMSGGTISGSSSNSSSSAYGYDEIVLSYGGGVYAGVGFIKTGGIIYGNDASSANKNTVTGRIIYGHAVYLGSGYYRDSTLGAGDNLSSSSPLPASPGQTLNGWTKR